MLPGSIFVIIFAGGAIAFHVTPIKNIRKTLYGCMLVGMLFSTLGAGGPSDTGTHLERNEAPTDPGLQPQASGNLQDFGLVSQTDGWILLNSRLYWMGSNGRDWNDITPVLPPAATIQAVKFLDEDKGWVLWSLRQGNGSLVLQLERTSDQGGNWTDLAIQTLTPDNPDVDMDNASMDWLDENTGWVSVKQQTGSNFSSGRLFRTEDGGQTWVRLSLPIGEPVHFVNRQVGWMAGGPAGDDLFKTSDGGNTWERQPAPGGIVSAQGFSLYPPVFDSPENGLLPVVTQKGNDFLVEFYSTGDEGQNWLSVSSLPLGSQVGRLPLSLLDEWNLVVAIPNSDRIIHMLNGNVETILNQDGMSAGIVDLKMRTSDLGWAKWHTAACTKQSAEDGSITIACTATTKLIETRDGGITWEPLPFPGISSGALTQNSQTASTGLAQVTAAGQGKTLLFAGQGFDQCEITTLPKLQSWWNSSPYQIVNLYIGGAARACPNTALTAAYVDQMRQQGWAFIPTWVGPQAPCTTFTKRFSSNVNTAFVQGKDEAYFALARLAELGLTYANKSGSVVYYDMEIYGNDPSCRNAVNAFVNGWVTHIHNLGNLAGVYGATGIFTSNGCTSGLSDYLAIPNIPDVIWPARWYHPAGEGTYDPAASVWDIGKCVPGTAWNNHQRIRQYAGDHYETWGGVMLNSIDDNVLDGVVAIPFFGTPSANFSALPLSEPPLTVQFTITNTAFMSSCTWDYGDGQTGSSCDYNSTHTYKSAGTYTVSLTVSSPWGMENLKSSISINVTTHWIFLPQVIR